jgi:3-hydroxybutyryl-CoA dehydratase
MPDPSTYTLNQLSVGQTASFNVIVTADLVRDFAAVSGDQSPLHMDEAYAAQTPYGTRIAHGMLGGALFSQLIGMHLPGKHAVYLSQDLRFKQPVTIGMNVTVRGTITHKTPAAAVITIHTELYDATSETLLTEGTALVRVLA